jgi:lipoprotein NlpI
MNLRYLLVLLFMLVTKVYADDASDCEKSSGDIKISACTRAIDSGRWQGADLAWAYNNRGNAKQDKGDADGAFSDFQTAIELNPRYANAYNNLGIAKRRKGDFDGAMADYNRAIDINPHLAPAFYNRGLAKARSGDIDGAMSDYNRAIEINPEFSSAYNNRGYAKYEHGDLSAAMADYNRALELNPQFVEAFTSRGQAHYYLGEFALASADLARAQELKPDPFTALWLYLARTRNGADGKSELLSTTSQLNASKWPAPVVALYLGNTTPRKLLLTAENPDPKTGTEQRCWASFYLGSWQLFKGDRDDAIASLRMARDECPKTFIEYSAAVLELKRLAPN